MKTLNWVSHRQDKKLTACMLGPVIKRFLWVIKKESVYYWAICRGEPFTLGFCQIVSPASRSLPKLIKKIAKLEYLYEKRLTEYLKTISLKSQQ